ncbi:hypothetical protein BC834DRAFT_898435 [Gloeopeniophorella convolvens]|nr:hypothetical protein BC834DRAFT_898435 [Gloeopeniophorella convolvens]
MIVGSRGCCAEVGRAAGGGRGVPGTSSTFCVSAKRRARLRKALGASGVVGSRWSMCSARREAFREGWWRKRESLGRSGARVEVGGLRVVTTSEIGPGHLAVQAGTQSRWSSEVQRQAVSSCECAAAAGRTVNGPKCVGSGYKADSFERRAAGESICRLDRADDREEEAKLRRGRDAKPR